MNDPETPLQMAQRHVASQEALIAKQWALIRRLQHADLPTAGEMDMLALMESTLETFRQDLDRISRLGS